MNTKLLILLVVAATGCFAAKFKPTVAKIKTTRQWDCCKQSCAWKDNAKSCAKPVRSCLADGKTTAPENAKSGCQGGTAFACTDQTPFVIGDHAYAFVAGTRIGGDPDVCCTCWELTFTEGPVKGKKMTVQVTNGGEADIMENHFDIQMPMSGRGLFPSGCINQWGLKDEVWGPAYGGISTENQCHKGPKELLKGCQFRFGSWWKNANNPHADIKRVSCPKAITDISGCKRHDD